MNDLNKLKELAGKATPGPWAMAIDWERAAVYSTSKDAYPEGKRVVCSGNQNNKGRYNAESWSGSDWSDAAFIAAANPATVIGLIEQLEAAQRRIAEVEARLRGTEESLIAAVDHAEAAEAELSRRGEAALPPTVMKPIDLSECRTLWYEHDDLSSEVECIPVMDIKKAIRAAGYQVEGG